MINPNTEYEIFYPAGTNYPAHSKRYFFTGGVWRVKASTSPRGNLGHEIKFSNVKKEVEFAESNGLKIKVI